MVFLVLEQQLNLKDLETFHVVGESHQKYLLYCDQKIHLVRLN